MQLDYWTKDNIQRIKVLLLYVQYLHSIQCPTEIYTEVYFV